MTENKDMLPISSPYNGFESVQSDSGNDDSVVILFTNDEHCHVDTGIGFAGISAMKHHLKEQGKNVVLVSSGDIFQGLPFSLPTKGAAIMELLERTGYDFFTLGNHEFEHGTQQLGSLLAGLKKARCVCSNLTYGGTREDGGGLSSVVPYSIWQGGKRKVAFLGVTTPETLTEVAPDSFAEDGRCVYDFFGGAKPSVNGLAKVVQNCVNICRRNGADTIVLLSHLGDVSGHYNSRSLIKFCHGIDLVLDGHDHRVICDEQCVDHDGKPVHLVSTGAMFQNVARIDISGNGKITSRLVQRYDYADEEIVEEISKIRARFEKKCLQNVGHSDFGLPVVSKTGARVVRCRETAIGNFCADACALVYSAEIAFLNTGMIRAGLPSGDINYGNIVEVFPFGDRLNVIEVRGRDLLDALEVGCKRLLPLSESQGRGIGEFGGFPAVSGLNFTVKTSLPTPVRMDENGNFTGLFGKRRICDVWLTDNRGHRYTKFDINRKYSVVCTDFAKSGGNGYTMFRKYRPILPLRYTIGDVIAKAIPEIFGGEIPRRYATTENRIIVK